PDTSLMIDAPARTASSATSACRVSTDTVPTADNADTTGMTRSSSSATETGPAPGRVDSPPTSPAQAPSSNIAFPAAIARSAVSCLLPDQNESGVAFTMPITRNGPTSGRAATSAAPASATGFAMVNGYLLGSRRTTTDFEVGVFETSATESNGTNGLVSG